jgi:hypothetical protein
LILVLVLRSLSVLGKLLDPSPDGLRVEWSLEMVGVAGLRDIPNVAPVLVIPALGRSHRRFSSQDLVSPSDRNTANMNRSARSPIPGATLSRFPALFRTAIRLTQIHATTSEGVVIPA